MTDKKIKPKLILITEYYTPSNNAPGARFGPLVQSLDEYFSVFVFTSKVSRILKDKRVRCNFVSFPGNTRSVFFRLVLELLFSAETFWRLLFSKADTYYITSPSFFNCAFSFFYCKLFSRRYIVDVRDDYPRVFFDNYLVKEKSFIGKFLLALERRIYLNAYLVIAATEGLKNSIKEKFEGEVYLLRNGFSERSFIPTREKYEKFTLVLHGNLGHYQDIELIKEIGRRLEQKDFPIDILIIGKGSEDYKLTREIPRNIKYIGPQPYEKIPHLISRAHVGLSFRKPGKISEDSFPVRAYEYLGVGLPIIITPISEAGNFLFNHGIGFQFEAHDMDSILDAIMRLYADNNLYESLVSKIHLKRNKFSREKMSVDFAKFLIEKTSESVGKHSQCDRL